LTLHILYQLIAVLHLQDSPDCTTYSHHANNFHVL